MNTIDLIVLFSTLALIVGYGVWKTRENSNIESYLRGNNSMKWGTIGLSVMATQASAITFISTPGQGYQDGMAFIQNYLGMPIALIIVATVFIPLYYRLKVYTAYEFLESRFDVKTRILGATLFLIQRGLAAGITIYAPAIILSSVLKWDLNLTILLVGGLVIIYTVSGGTRAVSITQKQQMGVILIGMVAAFVVMLNYIGEYATFGQALGIAGKLGKLDAIDLDFDLEKRYTIWSGLAAGIFLQLSYFGTDQSQVGRYLGGKNMTESKVGLMFNAMLKIPMQFFILLVGAMLYVFYIFYVPPVHFNQTLLQGAKEENQLRYQGLESYHLDMGLRRIESGEWMAMALRRDDDVMLEAATKSFYTWDAEMKKARTEMEGLIKAAEPEAEMDDSDYVFLTFILTFLPTGLVGLLIAVIFSAAMSSTSSEINALASTSVVDYYKRLFKKDGTDKHYVIMSKLLTLIWGLIAIVFAIFANNSENLIEAVNIVGSLFYGTILGIFLVAFFFKFIQGTPVFVAALIAQVTVIVCHVLSVNGVIGLGYLWYNVIGCMLTIILGIALQPILGKKTV
ncbi:MAG: sodium:solute symporter [Cyclobacteriaceae bacterium]